MKPIAGLFWVILLSGFMFINQAIAQEIEEGTRITIATSGPAEFSSYWLDNPHRLVVEFQSRNILTKVDNEVIVNQGVIKRITSSYFGKGKNSSLKSLTFELTETVPYKIWQENNNILLDIQIPAGSEPADVIIERLGVMDTVLTQMTESEVPIALEGAILEEAVSENIKEAEEVIVAPNIKALPTPAPVMEKRSILGMIYLVAGLSLISGLGLLIRRKRRLDTDKKIEGFKLKLEEKDKRLKQEEIVREAIENASLEKAKEYEQLRNSFKSLRDRMAKEGLLKKKLSPEQKEKPWILGESSEKRQSPRLNLTRDYNKTILLRINPQNEPLNIKAFASDISSGGISFESKKEFTKKDPLNLRLFFYGSQAPMVNVKAQIKWKKTEPSISYYGAGFVLLEEKDRIELSRYIESNIKKD